jgi:phage repressor protein C with HTH and peptisase S24 domain
MALENLKKVISEKFSSDSEAADFIFPDKKARRSTLSLILSSDEAKKFKKPTLDAIKKAFPEYNINWLLYNKGQRLTADARQVDKVVSEAAGLMLKEIDEYVAAGPISNTRDLGQIQYPLEGDAPFIDLGDGKYIMVVPLVNEYAYAGYLSSFSDPEYLEELPKHTIIVDKHHRGQYRAFEIVGDSMDNDSNESIVDGSIATGREIQQHLWVSKFHTHRYKDYIIVSKTEGIIAKRIIKQDLENGTITLHSLNADKDKYPDFDMHLDDIQQMFNIVAVTEKR